MTAEQFEQYLQLQQHIVQAVSLFSGLFVGMLLGLIFFVIWKGVVH